MAPVVLVIGVTYFGYFKLLETISVKNTKLYDFVFQKSDLMEAIDY